jgi:hypothetical protein
MPPMVALITLRMMPIILNAIPAIATPLREDPLPMIPAIKAEIEIGRPQIGKSYATSERIPRINEINDA